MDRRTLRTRSSRLALLLLLVVAGAAAFVHQQRLSFAPPARLSLSAAAAAAAAAASRRPAVAAGWTPSSSTGSTSTSTSSHRTGLSLPSFPRRHQSRRWAAVAGGGAAGTGGNDLKEKVLATVRSLYFPLTVLGAGVLGPEAAARRASFLPSPKRYGRLRSSPYLDARTAAMSSSL